MENTEKDLNDWWVKEKVKIEEEFGKPSFKPLNEAGKRYQALSQEKHRRKMKIEESRPESRTVIKAPGLICPEENLANYGNVEKAVIREYFKDLTANHAEVANRVDMAGVSSQLVTSILNQEDVQELIHKVLATDIGRACEVQIARGVSRGDQKFIELALKFNYGFSSKSCDHEESKPIESPFALQSLKEVGDWLGQANYTLVFQGTTDEKRVVSLPEDEWKNLTTNL